ncbi:hypothetical protein GCM10011394_11400 [Luteimonas terricola]|uniref:Uncharacterized protein n=1 Tax=Luteimonas terricola TaxID=645597 RepID=A0ABQ2EDE7_9GAMM|nr:hypothetical protein GCM10011394_11400 [Luteimonas terricola]
MVVVLLLVLPWFGYRHVRDWIGPRAGPEVDAAPALTPAESSPPSRQPPTALLAAEAVGPAAAVAADEVEAIGRDARAGDGEAATARLADLGAQVHRDALLADRGSAVRREEARRGLAAMPGVRGAGWVDRMTLLLLVSSRSAGHATLSEACRRLAAHGDVSGLAVRVQEVAADAPAAASLQAECRPGTAAAAPATLHGVPGASLRVPETGADAEAEDPEAAAERRRREEESLRILSENTPALPLSPPDPRVDP